MDNFDRLNSFDKLNIIRDKQPITVGEMPSSDQDTLNVKTYSRLTKIVSIILIVILLLSLVYAFLHPIYKLKLKIFLFNSCTLEATATGYGSYMLYQKEDILIDGNLMKVGSDYYELDGGVMYKYVETGKNTWKRIPADEEWVEDSEVGEKLLDRNSYKRIKGRLFAWRLKNSVAETIDDLSSITLERDAGKIAIKGYNSGVHISIRFTRFGRTKIDPPWEEPGMTVEE